MSSKDMFVILERRAAVSLKLSYLCPRTAIAPRAHAVHPKVPREIINPQFSAGRLIRPLRTSTNTTPSAERGE